jgi:hypothetical protein
MREKKIISIILVLLFISLIPIAIAAENQTEGIIVSTGYGETSIFGLFPKVSGDSLTMVAILPPFGKITIAKPRFNGHIGLVLVYGKYQWFANGPPAFPTAIQ